jgi:Lar family restriction alleviation protein
MTDDALKACPFCGSSRIGAFENMGQQTIHGQCLDCGVEGPGAKAGESPIAVWNTRAEPDASVGQPVVAPVVEGLQKAVQEAVWFLRAQGGIEFATALADAFNDIKAALDAASVGQTIEPSEAMDQPNDR